MNTHHTAIDLPKYFQRIAYSAAPSADLATLHAIHLAHATHIPFENIDVLLGRPIRLDLPSLADKLIDQRRGGYCFEQNALLAAVLEELGFKVTRLLARVRIGGERLLPRTHMVLEVAAEGQSWLADVGFGAWGLLDPLPLTPGDSRQHAWTYRLANQGAEWTLSAPIAGQWHPLYTFTREPQLPVDYEPANWYTSTHPDSRFVQTLTAQMPTPDTRYPLRNRELTVVTADGLTTYPLNSDADLLRALAEKFRLQVPAGPWLPAEA